MEKEVEVFIIGEFTTFFRGNVIISDNILQIDNTTINLSNIDAMNKIDFPKHSLFYGFKQWFIGLIVIIILCAFIKNLEIIFSLYLLTIFILIAYNINEHKKNFYGLEIGTSGGKTIVLSSDSEQFIYDIRNTITKCINNKKANYTINLDDHKIVNNGIINKGNNNRNKVVKKNDK